MSTKRPHVDAAVIAVVKAWAAAPDLDAAAAALADGRRALDPPLQAQLRQEVAEISAHTLLDLMTLERGVEDGEKVKVGEVELLPKQIERVSAWKLDQAPTAAALGLEVERWHELVLAGMEVVCAEIADGGAPTKGAAPGRPVDAGARMKQARALLGDRPAGFTPPPASTSEKAGLTGLLAAKAFAKGKGSGK